MQQIVQLFLAITLKCFKYDCKSSMYGMSPNLHIAQHSCKVIEYFEVWSEWFLDLFKKDLYI